ncbi:MAG: DNA-3-methyladenine glycosylase I [Burkholderiaceae bacterium]|jgi:DNA-3-methyladenine glycosylase I
MTTARTKAKQAPVRCAWANLDNPLYLEYHDTEWGTPCHDETRLFEMLNLEGAQAGLSWETVLNKRAHYREVFDRWDAEKIARYGARKVNSLLADPGIIRNRLKIAATIENARLYLDLREKQGGLDPFLWSYVGHRPVRNRWKSLKETPATSPLSDQISRDMKKLGFKFVGSTIIYAYLQAVGVIDDHTVGCFRHGQK